MFCSNSDGDRLYAQDLQSVSFDEYLKTFDYKERKNMKIEIPEMLSLYKQGTVQIIDIRFPEEYQTYSFSFIKNIPLNELPERLGELDKTKIIITICPHYDRAEIARTYLTLKGFRSRYLVAGAVGLADTSEATWQEILSILQRSKCSPAYSRSFS